MHILQPKHTKLNKEEAQKLLEKLNISLSQLPKISKKDPILPENCNVGDILTIERKFEQGIEEYFKVVI